MLLKAFGKNPSGNELKKVQVSSNFLNNSFQNLMPTKLMESVSVFPILWQFMNKPKNTIPPKPLPSVRTDLKSLPDDAPVIIWFGHSSYLIKINGIHILVDPVFSGHVSPIFSSTKSFPGTDIYAVEDLPSIDVLLISHDHYDHLDYETIKKLMPQTQLICTSLGVSSHLSYWGIDAKRIIEFDWWESHEVLNGIQLTAVPARHFSGRTLVRNKTLWSSFVLQTKEYKIFIGADSGYGSHFSSIQKKFHSFDIAVLECGQYNIAWHDIHMLPEETAQACIDLNAKVLMPVHWGKFSISLHAWDEPVNRLCLKAGELNVKITTPIIGEPVIIGHNYPDKQWWRL